MESAERPIAKLAGFSVAAVNAQAFLDACKQALAIKQPLWIVTLNLEMVSRCRLDAAYRGLLSKADLFIADGMPLVWGSKLKRGVPRIPERLTGSDLADELLTLAPSDKIAILGGKDPLTALRKAGIEEPEKAYIFAERVSATPEEADRFAQELKVRGSQIIFLALGVPKQDRMAALLRERIDEGILIGVGGTFELMSGELKKAPRWMKKAGFEWLFRLLQEPRRLAHRYLVVYWVGGFALAGDVVKSWFKKA